MSATAVSERASVDADSQNPWGWLLIGTGFIVWFVVDGIVVSYAVLLNHFLATEDMALLSWVGAVARGHVMVIGIIAGPLTKSFGCPLVTFVGCLVAFLGLFVSAFSTGAMFLLFSFGIFGGWGYSLAIMPSVFQATLYFKRHKALALGLITCGSGVGPLVFAPLSQYVIDISSWRNVFVMNSLFCLMLAIFVADLTRPQSPRQTYVDNYNYCKSSLKRCITSQPTTNSEETEETSTKVLDRSSALLNMKKELQSLKILAGSSRLILMCSAGFVTHLGLFEVQLFLPAYASASGIDAFSGAVLLSYFGLANTIGRIWIGWVMDKNWLPLTGIYISVIFLGAVITFAIPFITNYNILALMAILYGVSIGTCLGMRSVVIIENMGAEAFQGAFGLYLVATGVGSAIGPPCVGYIFTATSDSYTWLFGVGAAFLLVGFVIWSMLPFIVKLEKRRKHQEFTENLCD